MNLETAPGRRLQTPSVQFGCVTTGTVTGLLFVSPPLLKPNSSTDEHQKLLSEMRDVRIEILRVCEGVGPCDDRGRLRTDVFSQRDFQTNRRRLGRLTDHLPSADSTSPTADLHAAARYQPTAD